MKSPQYFLTAAIVLGSLFRITNDASGQQAAEPAVAASVDSATLEQPVAHEFENSPWFASVSATYQQVTPEPLAVLLVTAAPDRAASVAEDPSWLEFCRESEWSLAVVSVQTAPELERPEEAPAREWLDKQVFRWLDTAAAGQAENKRQLPVFACLFGDTSDLLLPSVLERPSRVLAWATVGASRFPIAAALPRVNNPVGGAGSGEALSPGVLIGEAGNQRLAWDFLQSLRGADPRNRLSFLPYQGPRLGASYLEGFARRFLLDTAQMTLEFDGPRWLRYSDGEPLTEEMLEAGDIDTLADYIWFPSEETAGAWKSLCALRPAEPDYVVKMFSRTFPKLPPFFSRLEFHHNKLHEKPTAVLLVAVDTDRPQATFQDRAWVNFAREQGWALMVMNVRNGRRINSHDQAAAWLEARLFDFIDKGPYKDKAGIPIVFHATGQPAYWMQRILVKQPKRFRSWCVAGAPNFAIVPPDQAMPPGLIVAPRPDFHFSHLFFLQDLRKANRSNRVCLLAQDENLVKVSYIDEWARQFLAAALHPQKGNGFWLRYRDGQRLNLVDSTQGVDPADYVWLPNDEVAGTWDLLSRARPQIPFPLIEKQVVKTRLAEQPELNIFVRIPGRSAKAKGQANPVRGVLCFCTWQKEDSSLVNRLKNSLDPLVQFADRNDLAVITWNTAALLPPGTWEKELDEAEVAALEARFDQVGKSWVEGVGKICRLHKLPENNFLLFGISRGSTYAHRLALRYPEKFLAVHTHIGSHYEAPNEKSKDLLWLVTTGELDGGYLETKAFYEQAKELGYPVLIKAGASLGHAMRDDIEALSLEFFDNALYLKETADQQLAEARKRGETGERLKQLTAAQLYRDKLKTAGFFGDFINHEVYPVGEGEWIPESQRIALPTEDLARAWGAVPDLGP